MLSKALLICFLTVLCRLIDAKFSTLAEKDPDYNGCGKDHQCFGMPNDCIDHKSCTVLLKTRPVTTSVEFNLSWKRSDDSSDKYVSVALSDDRLMSNDSATIYVLKDNASVDAYQGFTYGGSRGFGVNRINVVGVEQVLAKYEDGLLSGTWRETHVIKVEGKTFDLKNNKYYIFMVYGPLDDQGNPRHHSHKWSSENALTIGL